MSNQDILDTYALGAVLLEKLSLFEGSNINRQKIKFHVKGLVTELEKFDDIIFKLGDGNEMNDAVNSLKDRIDGVYRQELQIPTP